MRRALCRVNVRVLGWAMFPLFLFGVLLLQPPAPRVAASGPPERARPARSSLLSEVKCEGGRAGEFPCRQVDLLALLPLDMIGGGSGSDLWGWTDPLTGREYALMGRSSGTAFVDITDPTRPRYLGQLPSRNLVHSSWRDIKVYRNHAFIVADESGWHGVQRFDLTQLREVTDPPVTFTESGTYMGVGSAHNIAINEESGYAYVTGASVGEALCGGGLHMIDLRDPTTPTFAGCFSEGGYVHDAQCVRYHGPDRAYRGREICFNASAETLVLADVTDKVAPRLLARASYPGVGYIHQNWLTEDHRYLLLNDENDEIQNGHNTRTYIWDVADLDAPRLLGFYSGPTRAIDHNLYVHEGYAYEANYQSGLRILDLARVADAELTEVAFFDIYPAGDGPAFNGAWSVYPFFGSGTVIVSGIEQGLFLLRPHLPADYTLQPERSELSICGDGRTENTVALLPWRNYQGTVQLQLQGLPPGATATLTRNPVEVPGESGLSLAVEGVPAATYPLTLRGTDGERVHEASLLLQVQEGPPAAVRLAAPASGSSRASAPALLWEHVPGAQSYHVEIADDEQFDRLLLSAEAVEGTALILKDELAPGSYYWRVRARNACGEGPDSEIGHFTLLPPVSRLYLPLAAR